MPRGCCLSIQMRWAYAMLIFRSVGVNALSDAARCIRTTLHRRWSLCLPSFRRTRVSSMSLSATFVLSSTMITCPVIAFISTRIVFPSPMLHRRRIDRYLTFSFRHEFHKTKLQYSFFKAVVPSIFTRPPIYADTLSRANRSIPLHSTYSNFKGSTSPAVMARKTVERFPRVHAPRRASLGASRRLYLARLVSTLCHPSERSSVDS